MVENSGHNIQLLLKEQLKGCSKQRLRALEVCLRRYSNDEQRISTKDLLLALQENEIHLSDRAMAEVCVLYQDCLGINYQRLHDCFMETHAVTGRDSVLAVSSKKKCPVVPNEQKISDILQRLQESVKTVEPFNVTEVEQYFLDQDMFNNQVLPETLVLSYINQLDLQIYGSLLKGLAAYFLEGKNLTLIRWKPFLEVLDIILKKGDISKVETVLSSTKTNTKTHYKFVKKSSAKVRTAVDNDNQNKNGHHKNDNKIVGNGVKGTGIGSESNGIKKKNDKPHQNSKEECNGSKIVPENGLQQQHKTEKNSLLPNLVTESAKSVNSKNSTKSEKSENVCENGTVKKYNDSRNNKTYNNKNSNNKNNNNNNNNNGGGDDDDDDDYDKDGKLPNLRFGLHQLALTMTRSIPGIIKSKKSIDLPHIINMQNISES
ncbi:integrator complex subunit 1 homolog [Argonauta hians]